jgi:cell division septal protein FtsQ
VRHVRPVRRASAGLTPVRAGGLLVVLASIAGLYGAASSDAFAAHRTAITGATWTSDEAVRSTLAVAPGQNLFLLRTGELADRLLEVPAIRSADVSVALPDEIRVSVVERQALLAWQVGQRRFLVDGSGFLFGELGASAPAEAAALPVVDDRRAESATLAVGASLDAVSLDAALRIGSLTPAQIGSAAARLEIRVDDANGFVVQAQPAGWTATFGFYTPTLRTTDLIPGQVRLLRSLILGREETVLRVILADDASGTYVPRPTPAPSRTPKP